MLLVLSCGVAFISVFCVGQGCPAFFFTGPQPLLWASSRAARVKITTSSLPKRLYYCTVFTVGVGFTYVAGGRITQPGGSRVGRP